MKSLSVGWAVVLASVLVVSGCKKDDESNSPGGGGPTTTTYVGTVGNGSESGSLNFTVDNAGAVTGSLGIVGSSSISLTGSLSGSNLSMTGGSYTFTGTLANQRITGGYTGPNGNGSFEADQASTTSAATYCGTYAENPPGSDNGTFNMIINNGSIRVMAVESGGGPVTNLEGTLNGSTITLHVPGSPSSVIATGTLSGNDVSGTYNNGTAAGTWSGAHCQ
jgi:hypothetical protein